MHNSRKTTSSIALDELKRRDQLESLRPFLISEQCFPSSKDPECSPISMEELKKLVRIWKLNERRNFWKTHSERDDIVAALIQHAEQVFNFGAPGAVGGGSLGKDNKEATRKSNGISVAEGTSMMRPTHPSDPKPSNQMRNFCGLKYFNRTAKPSELTIHSRFFGFPQPPDRIDNVVDRWRSEDFHLKDDSVQQAQANGTEQQRSSTTSSNKSFLESNLGNVISSSSSKDNGSGSQSEKIPSTQQPQRNTSTTGIRNKVKIMKQRNLALHLMNYSAHLDFKKTTFSVKSVQTFINVAESDDTKTVSNCMIALSNIAADPTVRSILLEINAMHRLTNMLQFLRGKSSHWAAGLLFYYFSCDKESEDRVYNASSLLLQANGSSKDPQVRLITLYTLNNLMPCIDRQRVAEFIMRILVSNFDSHVVFHDRHLSDAYLQIIQNMVWFSNVHSTLISCSVLDVLEKFAQFAVKNKNGEMGLFVAKILLSFLQLPDQAIHVVSAEYLAVLTTLFSGDHEPTLSHAIKAAVALSQQSPLRRLVLSSSTLLRAVAQMLTQKSVIGSALARESSKFLANMSLSIEETVRLYLQPQNAVAAPTTNMDSNKLTASTAQPIVTMSSTGGNASALQMIEKFVDDNVHLAVFAILKSTSASAPSKCIAIRALQNIVAFANNGIRLCSLCLDPMIKFLRDSPDVCAVTVLYNLACISHCREELVAAKIHTKTFELMILTREGSLKSSYLQILVQLSSSSQCVEDLLKLDLIAKLDAQLKSQSIKCDVWRDISLMLLAIVAFARETLSTKEQLSIVRVLRSICSPAVVKQAAQQYCKDKEKELAKEGSNVANGSSNSGSGKPVSTTATGTANSSVHYQTFNADQFLTLMTSSHIADILENGACILKFVSVSFDGFEEMDPVIRNIIDSTAANNEDVVESISHVLYNMTCYDRNIPLMLQDETYLNTMIRLMRSGKIHIQENIAHAMRTLCSAPQCVELLLRRDMLSDLIVIALLRTSSEEVKIICSEAFYNMLTHESTRLKLLQGDLWWALMRLGRTDSESVRSICVRALNDLATPLYDGVGPHGPTMELERGGLKRSYFWNEAGEEGALIGSPVNPNAALPQSDSNSVTGSVASASAANVSTTAKDIETKQKMQLQRIAALRTHHVLSFVRDLSTVSSPEILLPCLQVVHNIFTQFASLPPPNSATSQSVHSSGSTKNPTLAAMKLQDAQQESNENTMGSKSTTYAAHEVIAAIRIAADAFHRGTSLKVVRIATLLLVKCAQLRTEIDGIDGEFLNIDIVDVLKATRESWSKHPECRLMISRLCFELAHSRLFSRSVLLSDLSPILYSAFESDTGSLEIAENILATLQFMVLNENVTGQDIVTLPIWPLIMRNILASDSPLVMKHAASLVSLPNVSATALANSNLLALSQLAATNDRRTLTMSTSGTANGMTPTAPSRASRTTFVARPSIAITSNSNISSQSGDGTAAANASTVPVSAAPVVKDVNAGPTPTLFRSQTIALSLLAHSIEAQLSDAAVNNENTFDFPMVKGILRNDLIDHAWTKTNLLQIIHSMSQDSKAVTHILQEETFSLLSRHLHTSTGTARQEKSIEFCSAFLRNCSLHAQHLPKLLAIGHGALNQLIKEIVESFTTPIVAVDLTVFFFHVASHLSSAGGHSHGHGAADKQLSPKFVLDMIGKVNGNSVITSGGSVLMNLTVDNVPVTKTSAAVTVFAEEVPSSTVVLDVISVNKYTISAILNKYSFHHGVDPSFIQNMFNYLQSSAAAAVPELMNDISFRMILPAIVLTAAHLPHALALQAKESMPTMLLSFLPDELCWQPVLHRDIKCQDTIVLKFSTASGAFYEKLEAGDSLPYTIFSKIIRAYESVREHTTMAGATRERDSMIAEEDNEEDHDDESHNNEDLEDDEQAKLPADGEVDRTTSAEQFNEMQEESDEDDENNDDDKEDDDECHSQGNREESSRADENAIQGSGFGTPERKSSASSLHNFRSQSHSQRYDGAMVESSSHSTKFDGSEKNSHDSPHLHGTLHHKPSAAKYLDENATDDKLPDEFVEVSHRLQSLDIDIEKARITEAPEQEEQDGSGRLMADTEWGLSGKQSVALSSRPMTTTASVGEFDDNKDVHKRSMVSLLKDEVALSRQASDADRHFDGILDDDFHAVDDYPPDDDHVFNEQDASSRQFAHSIRASSASSDHGADVNESKSMVESKSSKSKAVPLHLSINKAMSMSIDDYGDEEFAQSSPRPLSRSTNGEELNDFSEFD